MSSDGFEVALGCTGVRVEGGGSVFMEFRVLGFGMSCLGSQRYERFSTQASSSGGPTAPTRSILVSLGQGIRLYGH